jgi:DNA-binding transcriptional LysR family regulator
MRRVCPSISELLAFEAAARLGSFTLAAGELLVTQGAISKAVGGLEDFLRVQLFNRSGSRIALTDAGRSYLASITPLLASLEAATFMARTESGGRITVAAMPSFAERWILPRLSSFTQLHPRISLRFAPYTRISELLGGIDAAVRYGTGDWPGMDSHRLLGCEMVPIIGTGALPDEAPRTAATIADLPLIEHFQFPDKWPAWFEAHGLPRRTHVRQHTFDQYGMMIRAVAAGLGCALVPACLIESELAAGTVEAVSAAGYVSRQAYHLCIPQSVTSSPALIAFSEWLMREARRAEP